MKLPYYLSCSESGVNLYQLNDGRFQMITQGKIAPMMIGYGYALVEKEFAEYLEQLDLPRLDVVEAVIFDPKDKVEIRTHRQLLVGQHFSADTISDIDLDGERLLVMDNSDIFISSQLKKRLEEADFTYLRFSEGLSEFTG